MKYQNKYKLCTRCGYSNYIYAGEQSCPRCHRLYEDEIKPPDLGVSVKETVNTKTKLG